MATTAPPSPPPPADPAVVPAVVPAVGPPSPAQASKDPANAPGGGSPGSVPSPSSPVKTPVSAAVAPAFDFGITGIGLPPVKTVALPGNPATSNPSYDWGSELLDKFVEKVNMHSSRVAVTLGPADGPPPPPVTTFPGLPRATIDAEAKAVAEAAAGAGSAVAPPANTSGGGRSTYRRPPSGPKQKVLRPSFSKHRPSTRRQLV
jgi:hypothetical protein